MNDWGKCSKIVLPESEKLQARALFKEIFAECNNNLGEMRRRTGLADATLRHIALNGAGVGIKTYKVLKKYKGIE